MSVIQKVHYNNHNHYNTAAHQQINNNGKTKEPRLEQLRKHKKSPPAAGSQQKKKWEEPIEESKCPVHFAPKTIKFKQKKNACASLTETINCACVQDASEV